MPRYSHDHQERDRGSFAAAPASSPSTGYVASQSAPETHLLQNKKFDVVMADPPWRFQTRTPAGRGRCPDGEVGKFHYRTMTTAEIAALPVRDVTHAGSVLYLWATSPMVAFALAVMQAWGFSYRSQLVWVKERVGTGYWARNRHELLLIGGRSKARAPEPALRPDSVIIGQQREHSRKPDEAYAIVERCWPHARRLDLFARERRDGWFAWGDEIGRFGARESGSSSEPASGGEASRGQM